jgi:hypothetical protein
LDSLKDDIQVDRKMLENLLTPEKNATDRNQKVEKATKKFEAAILLLERAKEEILQEEASFAIDAIEAH